jgi:F-type H+-transporting ATPase subunit epsilon
MLTLSLVTPAKKILTDVEISEIFVPTEGGELNILEGHAPLMALLDVGVLRYKLSGQATLEQVVISWGYLEVSKDQITVLAETAETVDMIDVARAQEALKRAEKTLLGADLEQEQFKKYQLKLERAMIRVQVAQKPSETNH